MSGSPLSLLKGLCEIAPKYYLEQLCDTLKTAQNEWSPEVLSIFLPETSNPDLDFATNHVLKVAYGMMTWSQLGWALESAVFMHQSYRHENQVDLLWSGSHSPQQIKDRRIDQVLYDLVNGARESIWLVTFAATRIQRLNDALIRALNRGVQVKLILEFEAESEGQLSRDALNAFSEGVISRAEVYYWPLDQRTRNSSGRPGKLHAKTAVVDASALISSANLTDDAFNRNLELGVLFHTGQIPRGIREHLQSLMARGILKEL